MNSDNNELEMLAGMFNWIADIFYNVPTAEKLVLVDENITQWPDENANALENINTILQSLKEDGFDTIKRDFYKLFIGPGKKAVYPWGSIYTDKENLLFGDTTTAWEQFCREKGIQITPSTNEPTDHFALIFSAISAVLNSEQAEDVRIAIIKEIVNTHFSPWGEQVLTSIIEKAKTGYYQGFAMLAQNLLGKVEAL